MLSSVSNVAFVDTICQIAYVLTVVLVMTVSVFFFQAEDGIRDLVRSRGLGDVYKRQSLLMIGFPQI